ncbi:unnamed protein product, partial [marine sediment metagenome]
WIEHTKEIEQDTGYIIDNIGVCNNVGGTIWYQLTHCGIQTIVKKALEEGRPEATPWR